MAVATGTTVGTIVLAGDLAGGSDPTNPQLTPTGVTPGKYIGASVIVDAKGRIVNAQKLSGLDVGCATKTRCGIAKIGREITATTASDGRTVASLKKASTTEFGVVKLGSGFGRTCCEIFLSYAVASPTAKGIIQVPPSGYLKLVDAILSIPLATTTTMGTVSVPTAQGLSITAGVMNYNSASTVYPDATASATGVVKVPTATGLSVAVDGTVSYNSSGTTFAKATTTTPGLISVPTAQGLSVNSGMLMFDGSTTTGLKEATTGQVGILQVGSGLAVSSGLMSIPTGTTSVRGAIRGDAKMTNTSGTLAWTTPATATVLGGIKAGTGVGVAADGTMSVGGGDATSSSKGLIQGTTGQGLTLVNAVLDVVVGSTTEKGILRGDASFTNTAGTLSVDPIATASTAGFIKIGANITLTGETISATESLNDATPTDFGKVQIGSGFDVDVDGVISVAPFTGSTLGLAKIGDGFTGHGVANARFVPESSHYYDNQLVIDPAYYVPGAIKNGGNTTGDFFKLNNGVISVDSADAATLVTIEGPNAFTANVAYPIETNSTLPSSFSITSVYRTHVCPQTVSTFTLNAVSNALITPGIIHTIICKVPTGGTIHFGSGNWSYPVPEGSTTVSAQDYVTTSNTTIITAVSDVGGKLNVISIV